MKKLILFIIVLISLYCLIPDKVNAETESFDDVLSSLIGALDGDELNGELDEIWGNFNSEDQTLKDKLLSVINGDLSADYGNILSAVGGLIFSGLKDLLPVLISVCMIALLYSFVNTLNPEFLSAGTEKILYFTCYAAIIGLLLYKTFDITNAGYSAIKKYAEQMDVVFPLIITVMTATGANVSASVYQPAVAFLSTGITNIITSVLMPMIFFLILFTSVSGLSQTVKTGKLSGFISSAIKWILGICITVFTMFMSIQGLTAGMYDGITLRVTKYAIGNSVPIVGGFLKDGVDLFLAAGLLIKNSLGICGIVLIVNVFLSPVVELIAFSLFLKLAAGLIEPFADSRISDYLYKLANNLNYVLATMLVVCFMYIVTVVLLICTGGAFL